MYGFYMAKADGLLRQGGQGQLEQYASEGKKRIFTSCTYIF